MSSLKRPGLSYNSAASLQALSRHVLKTMESRNKIVYYLSSPFKRLKCLLVKLVEMFIFFTSYKFS